jgi:hypothetical protein
MFTNETCLKIDDLITYRENRYLAIVTHLEAHIFHILIRKHFMGSHVKARGTLHLHVTSFSQKACDVSFN